MKIHEDFPDVDPSNAIATNPAEPTFPEVSLNHPTDQRLNPFLRSIVSDDETTERSGEPADDVRPTRGNVEKRVTGGNDEVDSSTSNNRHTHQENEPDILHLLICVAPRYKRGKKRFYQELLPTMANDEDFFKFLRDTYYKEGNWWSWASPWSVSKVGHCRVCLAHDSGIGFCSIYLAAVKNCNFTSDNGLTG